MVAARVKHLYATFEHLIHELAKFGVVGGIAFGLTILVSNLFHFGLGLGPITSYSLATALAAVCSYFANRHWTWRHRDDSGIRRELPLFLLLSLIGLLISDIPLAISEYVLGLHSPLAYNISSTLIGTALGTLWRFWAFRRWVFLDSDPERDAEAAREALV
jgi:putative flippase GtrA